MSHENKLAYPQKLDIDSFPKEKRRRTNKKGFKAFRKLRRNYSVWKEDRAWKNKQKKKHKKYFFEKLLILLLGPIADFRDDLISERNRKRKLKEEPRPGLFDRMYREYQERKHYKKQEKEINRKIKQSLSFDLEDDKRIFSFSEEINHLRDTWKSLPWDKTRELENIIVSTLVIVFSFIFNFALLQISKAIVAISLNIPTAWERGRIIFNIPDTSDLWTYTSVVSVYIVGPIILFFSGIIFLWLHRKTKEKNSFQAILFLWLYLTAFVIFFGSFLAGILTDKGFGYVLGWLFIPKYIEVPFGIFSILMLWMIGFSAGKKFISLTPGYAFYSSALPQFFIKIVTIYIPTILAIIVLLLIGLNSRDFTILIIYLAIIAMLTPTLRFIPEKME